MNKTLTANISGIVFHIDEKAYEILKNYLEAIKDLFNQFKDKEEIINDIEARIAEIFQERLKNNKQVISNEDVEQVIQMMGTPEDFTESETGATPSEKASSVKGRKRLYRDSDNKIIGGVCSGISANLDIDPIWIRLAFVIAFISWGFGLLLYLILWIIIPKARTTSEKLEMRGERINISNIEKSVKEEVENLKESINSFSKKHPRASNFFNQLVSSIGSILNYALRFAIKFFIIIIIFVAVIILFFLFIALLGVLGITSFSFPVSFQGAPYIMHNLFDLRFSLPSTALIILISIPLIALVFKGLQILLNIKARGRAVYLSLLGLWVIAFIFFTFGGIRLINAFSAKASIENKVPILQPSTKTLYINFLDNDEDKKYYNFSMTWEKDTIKIQNLSLNVEKSNTDQFELIKVQSSRGSSKTEAHINAKNINYNIEQQDSMLLLNPEFILSKDSEYRGQSIELTLKVPVGKRIYLDEDVDDIFNYHYTIGDCDELNDKKGKIWEMTEEGLKCIGDNEVSSEKLIKLRNTGFEIIEADKRVKVNEDGVTITENGKEKIKINQEGVIINN